MGGTAISKVGIRRCPTCEWVRAMPGDRCTRCGASGTKPVGKALLLDLIDSGDVVWCDGCKAMHTGAIKPAGSLL